MGRTKVSVSESDGNINPGAEAGIFAKLHCTFASLDRA